MELQREEEALRRYGFDVVRGVNETHGMPVHVVTATLCGDQINAAHVDAEYRSTDYGPSVYSLVGAKLTQHHTDIGAALRRVLNAARVVFVPRDTSIEVRVYRVVRHDLHGFDYSAAVWCDGVLTEYFDAEARSMAEHCWNGDLPGGVLWDWLCDYRNAA